MDFKFSHITPDNKERHRTSGQADHFPLEWFDKHPAPEGQDSILQTRDGDLVVETRDFEQVIIYLNFDPGRDIEKTRRLVQELMNTLVQDKAQDTQEQALAEELAQWEQASDEDLSVALERLEDEGVF